MVSRLHTRSKRCTTWTLPSFLASATRPGARVKHCIQVSNSTAAQSEPPLSTHTYRRIHCPIWDSNTHTAWFKASTGAHVQTHTLPNLRQQWTHKHRLIWGIDGHVPLIPRHQRSLVLIVWLPLIPRHIRIKQIYQLANKNLHVQCSCKTGICWQACGQQALGFAGLSKTREWVLLVGSSPQIMPWALASIPMLKQQCFDTNALSNHEGRVDMCWSSEACIIKLPQQAERRCGHSAHFNICEQLCM